MVNGAMNLSFCCYHGGRYGSYGRWYVEPKMVVCGLREEAQAIVYGPWGWGGVQQSDFPCGMTC